MRCDIPHGTEAGYQRGCRCGPCKMGKSAYQRWWRQHGKRFTPLCLVWLDLQHIQLDLGGPDGRVPLDFLMRLDIKRLVPRS
jgi:hypothetical protein